MSIRSKANSRRSAATSTALSPRERHLLAVALYMLKDDAAVQKVSGASIDELDRLLDKIGYYP